jgi:hypothetical protein
MQIVIEAADVWEDIKDCKPGDKKVVHFTVDSKKGEEIRGTATEAYYEDDEDEDQYDEDEDRRPAKKEMPKAIRMMK